MKSLRRILFCLMFAPVLVIPARRAYAYGGEPVVFQLQAEVKVDGKGVFLTQLVNPSLHASLPTLRLAPAPVLGQTTSLSRQQIIDLAKDAVPALNTTNWAGPPMVRIGRRVRNLCESEMLDMLRVALQRDYVGGRGELEIHFSRPWEALTVPDEPLSIQVTEVPSAGILPSLVVQFEIWCGKERVGSWEAPLQARVWRDTPVAHSQVLRGQLLRDSDIALERRDVLTQHETSIQFPVTDNSLEASSNIQAGAPIWSRLARPRAILRRGQLVEGIFHQGSMTISLKVQSLEDGALGQTVRVLNPKTRRELYGKIQAEDLVVIVL